MKKLILVLFCLLFIIIVTCSKDQPIEPSNEQNDLLAEATIGIEGGTISTDNFILTVPAGAFSTTADFKLYLDQGERLYEAGAVSSQFHLEGLPDVFTEPLRIAIKYQGILDGETFIAIGEHAIVPSLGQMDTVYTLFSATDSSGYLVYNLAQPEDMQTASKTYKTNGNLEKFIKLLALNGFHTYTTSDGHYIIISLKDKISLSQMQEVGSHMETAHDMILSQELSFENQEQWPIPVKLLELYGGRANVYGYYSPTEFIDSHGQITLNTSYMTDMSGILYTTGHELLHLVQFLYDSRSWNAKIHERSNHAWLDEATAVYFEEFFSNDPDNYVSVAFVNRELYPFEGLHWETGEHGYGCAPVIKYLCTHFLHSTLKNYFLDYRDQKHPIESIIFNADETTDWWPLFCKAYVQGELYGVNPEVFYKGIDTEHDNIIEIDGMDEIDQYVYGVQSDLSAASFMVKLNDPDIGPNDVLVIEIPAESSEYPDKRERVAVSVFEYSTNRMAFIDQSNSEIVVGNLDELTGRDSDIYGIITDTRANPPYTDFHYNAIHLKLEERRILASLGVVIRNVDADILIEYDGGSTEQSRTTHYMGFPSYAESNDPVDWGDCIIQTHDFIGADGNYYSGSITLNFEGDYQTISSFTAETSIIDDVGSLQSTRLATLSGENIPLTEDGNRKTYSYRGVGLCSQITDMTWSVNYKGSRVETLQPGWSCNDSTVIEIKINYK